MRDTIDYETVTIPDDKDPEDLSYSARRAEILEIIHEAGHPSAVNQATLARRYGCTRQNIAKDFDALAEYVAEDIGDRHVLATAAVFEKCITELLSAEEYRDAARTAKDHSDWVHERIEMRQLRERVDTILENQERARHR